MDLRQLRYFLSIADLGGMNRAAAMLRMTQPALSRQVQALEADLKVRLFERHGRGVRLTEAGRRLQERARTLLRQVDELGADVRDARGEHSGTIRIGASPAVGAHLLPALLERFRPLYPRMRIEVLSGFSSLVEDWLLAGKIDVGVLHNPEARRGVQATPLLHEPLCLIAPQGTRLPARGSVTLEQALRLPLILPRQPNRFRTYLDAEISRLGLHLNLAMEVDGRAVLMALIRQGLGCTIDTVGAVHAEGRGDEFRVVPLRTPMAMVLHLMVRRGEAPGEPLAHLAAMIPDICRERMKSGLWPARPV